MFDNVGERKWSAYASRWTWMLLFILLLLVLFFSLYNITVQCIIAFLEMSDCYCLMNDDKLYGRYLLWFKRGG
jgi:hypothetical protein